MNENFEKERFYFTDHKLCEFYISFTFLQFSSQKVEILFVG